MNSLPPNDDNNPQQPQSILGGLYNWGASGVSYTFEAVKKPFLVTSLIYNTYQTRANAEDDFKITGSDITNAAYNYFYNKNTSEVIALLGETTSNTTDIISSIQQNLVPITEQTMQLVDDIKGQQSAISDELVHLINTKYSLSRILNELQAFTEIQKDDRIKYNTWKSKTHHMFFKLRHGIFLIGLVLNKFIHIFSRQIFKKKNSFIPAVSVAGILMALVGLSFVFNPLALMATAAAVALVTSAYFIYKSVQYTLRTMDMLSIVAELNNALLNNYPVPDNEKLTAIQSDIHLRITERVDRNADLSLLNTMASKLNGKPKYTSYLSSIIEARNSIQTHVLSEQYPTIMLQKLSGVRIENNKFQRNFINEFIAAIEASPGLLHHRYAKTLLSEIKAERSKFGSIYSSYESITSDAVIIGRIRDIIASSPLNISDLGLEKGAYELFLNSFNFIEEIQSTLTRLNTSPAAILLSEYPMMGKYRKLSSALTIFINTNLMLSDRATHALHEKVRESIQEVPQNSCSVLAATANFLKHWSDIDLSSITSDSRTQSMLLDIQNEYSACITQEVHAQDMNIADLMSGISLYRSTVSSSAATDPVYAKINAMNEGIIHSIHSEKYLTDETATYIYTLLSSMKEQLSTMNTQDNEILQHYVKLCSNILNNSSFWKKNIFWRQQNVQLFSQTDSTTILSVLDALAQLKNLNIGNPHTLAVPPGETMTYSTSTSDAVNTYVPLNEKYIQKAGELIDRINLYRLNMTSSSALIDYEKIMFDLEKLSWQIRQHLKQDTGYTGEYNDILASFDYVSRQWKETLGDINFSQEQTLLVHNVTAISQNVFDILNDFDLNKTHNTLGEHINGFNRTVHAQNNQTGFMKKVENVFDHVIMAARHGEAVSVKLENILEDVHAKSKDNDIFKDLLNDLLHLPMNPIIRSSLVNTVPFAQIAVATKEDNLSAIIVSEGVTKSDESKPANPVDDTSMMSYTDSSMLSIWNESCDSMDDSAESMTSSYDSLRAIGNTTMSCIETGYNLIPSNQTLVDLNTWNQTVKTDNTNGLIHEIHNILTDSRDVIDFLSYMKDTLNVEYENIMNRVHHFETKFHINQMIAPSNIFFKNTSVNIKDLEKRFYVKNMKKSSLYSLKSLGLVSGGALFFLSFVLTGGLVVIGGFILSRHITNKAQEQSKKQADKIFQLHQRVHPLLRTKDDAVYRLKELYGSIRKKTDRLSTVLATAFDNQDIRNISEYLLDIDSFKHMLIHQPDQCHDIIESLKALNVLTDNLHDPLTSLLPEITECIHLISVIHQSVAGVENAMLHCDLSAYELNVINQTNSATAIPVAEVISSSKVHPSHPMHVPPAADADRELISVATNGNDRNNSIS